MTISFAPKERADTEAVQILRHLVQNGPAIATNISQDLLGEGRTRTSERSRVGNHLNTMVQLGLVQRTLLPQPGRSPPYLYTATDVGRALVESWGHDNLAP